MSPYLPPARIRLATTEDMAAVAAIYAPVVEHTAISLEEVPPDAAAMERRRARFAADGLPWLVAVEGDEVLGYAYAAPYNERAAYRWTVSASVYLAEAARGRGLGRQLYTELFALLKAQGYRSVWAGIGLPNEPSVRLHEGMGFVQVGLYPAAGFKHGAWCDVGSWRLELGQPDGPPAEPRPVEEVWHVNTTPTRT